MAGRIAAGSPIEAVEEGEQLDLERIFSGRGKSFVLEVQGDSMIDDHITDGDYVVVERRRNVKDGETVVALLDSGEATLKKLFREGKGFRLQPANSNFRPIHTDKVNIQGVVIGVIRKY